MAGLLLAGCSKAVTVNDGPELAQPGAACSREADCEGAICLAGFCREPCDQDSDCENSICLRTSGNGGCRLANEETCQRAGRACANAALVCGLDASCRLPCDDDCGGEPQACLAGACVERNEATEVSWFACETGRSCGGEEGADLISCNETKPGPRVLDSCDSKGTCQAGLETGACGAAACRGGDRRCVGASLERCRADESGWEPFFATEASCASPELCQLTRGQASPKACEPPVCEDAAARCSDGQPQRCAGDRTGWTDQDACDEGQQCNPSAAACVSLAVDATEVTRAQYAAFLAESPTLDVPKACAGNDLEPDPTCSSDSTVCSGGDCEAHPQVCVDWCDAWAYCAAKGQRLCGQLSGKVLGFSQFSDAGQSEWMNACSAGGEHVFPYGNERVNAACRAGYAQPLGTVAVGSLDACRSPVAAYAGLRDLSGNVAEWDDSCEKLASAGSGSDRCHVRGGSFASENDELACGAERLALRREAFPDVGFRCCGEP